MRCLVVGLSTPLPPLIHSIIYPCLPINQMARDKWSIPLLFQALQALDLFDDAAYCWRFCRFADPTYRRANICVYWMSLRKKALVHNPRGGFGIEEDTDNDQTLYLLEIRV